MDMDGIQIFNGFMHILHIAYYFVLDTFGNGRIIGNEFIDPIQVFVQLYRAIIRSTQIAYKIVA